MDPVLEYCRKQTVPEIFKYEISPKVQFYRDHSGGERLKVIQSPQQIAINGIKGFDARGDPPKHVSISRLSDRISLLQEPSCFRRPVTKFIKVESS